MAALLIADRHDCDSNTTYTVLCAGQLLIHCNLLPLQPIGFVPPRAAIYTPHAPSSSLPYSRKNIDRAVRNLSLNYLRRHTYGLLFEGQPSFLVFPHRVFEVLLRLVQGSEALQVCHLGAIIGGLFILFNPNPFSLRKGSMGRSGVWNDWIVSRCIIQKRPKWFSIFYVGAYQPCLEWECWE